jgi:predicted transcriptional regulator
MATQLSATKRSPTDNDSPVSEQELLELLGDEYTRRVLRAVTEQPRSGSEVVDAAEVSKATAYRRLGNLEDAGLIRSEMIFDPDGHHHERFHTVVDSIAIEFGSEGASVRIETDDENTESPGSPSVAD